MKSKACSNSNIVGAIAFTKDDEGFVTLRPNPQEAGGRLAYTDNKQADYRLVHDFNDAWELHWTNVAGTGLSLVVGYSAVNWPDATVCLLADDRADAERRRLLTEDYQIMTGRGTPTTLPPTPPAVQAMLDRWAEENKDGSPIAPRPVATSTTISGTTSD